MNFPEVLGHYTGLADVEDCKVLTNKAIEVAKIAHGLF